MKNTHTVVVVLEAMSGKADELKQALNSVISPSRAEKTCLEYRLHQDSNNPNVFILYENWESKEAHQAQFTKPYIIELINKIEAILAKPFQVYFAQELG